MCAWCVPIIQISTHRSNIHQDPSHVRKKIAHRTPGCQSPTHKSTVIRLLILLTKSQHRPMLTHFNTCTQHWGTEFGVVSDYVRATGTSISEVSIWAFLHGVSMPNSIPIAWCTHVENPRYSVAEELQNQYIGLGKYM